MQFQDGLRIADPVLIILRIVPAIKGEGAFADVAVNVFNFICTRDFSQDDHALFDLVLKEGSGLPQKAIDDIGVALREHGGHGIILGAEVKELEIITFRTPQPRVVTGIDIRKLIDIGP